MSRLDEQLEEMYAEYKTRTQRRVTAALRVEEEGEGGGRSKAQKRKAMREAQEAEAVDPEALAQQVAARELREEHDGSSSWSIFIPNSALFFTSPFSIVSLSFLFAVFAIFSYYFLIAVEH